MASSGTEQFSGKVVIVTGASSGIGKNIALTFAKRGAKVTLCGRNVTRLEKVMDKCADASGGHLERFLCVSGDMRDQEIRSRIVNCTVAQFGQLDILVCNAGVFNIFENIKDATENAFDNTFDINVKATFFLIQTALLHLEKSKGNILIISSVGSKMPCAPILIYPMSKAAVDHMTRCLALDLAPKGIRVNTVNPSYVITRLLRVSEDEAETALEERVEALKQIEVANTPLENRILASEEVSEAVVFLASDKASFITGQNLVVDGGRTLNGAGVIQN